MSKRITLQTWEIEQIVKALQDHIDATNYDYEVIRVGKRELTRIIDKLNAPTPPQGKRRRENGQ